MLVVDDSAVIRTLLCDQIASAPGLSVAGYARHGRDALGKVASLHPDVITLDIQMPEMDGLAVLDAILQSQPTPVIMVSSLTQAGAAITLEALDLGAADYVAKPEHNVKASQAFIERIDREDSQRGHDGYSPHRRLAEEAPRYQGTPGPACPQAALARLPAELTTGAWRWASRRGDRPL